MKDQSKYEKKILVAMIRIYCESVHGGKTLCNDCERLKEYALQRIDRCCFAPDKPVCKKCPLHCYNPKRRKEIREVMKFAGPGMIYKHPLLSMMHLLTLKKVKSK